MKDEAARKPSCSRISHENTSATSPMAIAVTAYWIAITFGVLAPDVLADEGLRVVQLDFADLRGRCEFRFVVRNVGHRGSLLVNAS